MRVIGLKELQQAEREGKSLKLQLRSGHKVYGWRTEIRAFCPLRITFEEDGEAHVYHVWSDGYSVRPDCPSPYDLMVVE